LLYSKTAIGSGGLLGKGYREGSVTQGKFVPEQSTDYIFCTVGEEWGFVGSTTLILLYALYIGRIYYLSERQKNIYNRVFGYCFASILLMHFSINIGMVMGLFPTVGIPLPFFSSGGTSLVTFSIMNFIFFKLNYADKNSLV
jgi:rod shape determining protein RodA